MSRENETKRSYRDLECPLLPSLALNIKHVSQGCILMWCKRKARRRMEGGKAETKGDAVRVRETSSRWSDLEPFKVIHACTYTYECCTHPLCLLLVRLSVSACALGGFFSLFCVYVHYAWMRLCCAVRVPACASASSSALAFATGRWDRTRTRWRRGNGRSRLEGGEEGVWWCAHTSADVRAHIGCATLRFFQPLRFSSTPLYAAPIYSFLEAKSASLFSRSLPSSQAPVSLPVRLPLSPGPIICVAATSASVVG